MSWGGFPFRIRMVTHLPKTTQNHNKLRTTEWIKLSNKILSEYKGKCTLEEMNMSTSGFLQGCAVLRGTNGFHPKMGGMSLLFFKAGPSPAITPWPLPIIPALLVSLQTEEIWQDSPAPPVWFTKVLTLSCSVTLGSWEDEADPGHRGVRQNVAFPARRLLL